MGYAILDQIGIRRDPGRDLPGTKLVEKGNVLAQDGRQIMLSSFLGNMLAGINETHRADVDGDEFRNRQIDEIKGVFRQYIQKLAAVEVVVKVCLKLAGQLPKYDLAVGLAARSLALLGPNNLPSSRVAPLPPQLRIWN